MRLLRGGLVVRGTGVNSRGVCKSGRLPVDRSGLLQNRQGGASNLGVNSRLPLGCSQGVVAEIRMKTR